MKYIAFPGTPNEQIFDPEERTITFTNSDLKVFSIIAVFGDGVWKKFNESKIKEDAAKD